ncbi:hypothetical protein INT44_000893 [Umbelopsis vinacea]|uniref:Mid2 domain-containing protein n=1 Tax=Umbelopsis vinacea TaxID=44442 RepID=A0A8H7Q8W1_9FUNG|nr:hypothetical protein INT44_000893 [Umbelopsis vinacea]
MNHPSVATHTQHIRSIPTLYDRHCKTDDDCPDVHCCNLYVQRCVLDPLGTICDIKPTTTTKKKTTTSKKSTTTHKTSTRRPSTTTKKPSNAHATDKSQPVAVLSETNPSSTPDPTTSAGDEGTTPGDQPVVNDPNAPAANPAVATPSSGSPTASSPSSSPTTGSNNGSQNNLANSDVVAGDITNKKLGIGIGVGVGCVAAIGLVGMAAFRRHEKRVKNASMDNASGDPVSTHWRPQSFMAVLGGVVAKLPRSSSTSSRGSSRIRSVFSNLSRNGSNRSNLSDQSVGSVPSLARIDEHYGDGQSMRQY